MVETEASGGAPSKDAHLLVVDTGSPVTSVAFGSAQRVLASDSLPTARSSSRILSLIHGVLDAAGAELSHVGGLVALAGPGSFTGLRVGLATLLGLHQALAVPATTVSSLEVLAFSAGLGPHPRLGAVDALRDEWFIQPFRAELPLAPLAEPALVAAAELSRLAPARMVGFGDSDLEAREDWSGEIELEEAGPLAETALRLLASREQVWDPLRLTQPLYLRPPAAKRAQG